MSIAKKKLREVEEVASERKARSGHKA